MLPFSFFLLVPDSAESGKPALPRDLSVNPSFILREYIPPNHNHCTSDQHFADSFGGENKSAQPTRPLDLLTPSC